MKTFITTIILFSALMLQNVTLHAQGVFVTPGAKGPVFSDKPQSGSKEVTLQPLNVVAPEPASRPAEPAPAPGTGESTMPEFTVPAYRSFSVVSPEDNGSAAANTALFEVRVTVDPPLQLGHNSGRFKPGGIAGSTSTMIFPGFRSNPRRSQ